MFKNPFSFDGRIRRTEYWITFVIYVLVAGIANIMMENGGEVGDMIGLVYFPLLWFLWAQGAKRCHDFGKTGWLQIVPFYVLWLLFARGNPGENEYGPKPR